MRRAGGLVVLAALVLLAGCKARDEAGSPDNAAAPRATVVPVPAGLVDQVVETPQGGFRMGSPTARAALVEYGSYTCPHCGAFAGEARPGIRRLVAAGKLSFEYRSYAREEIDLAAALVARCAGADRFFAVSDRIFAAQLEWVGKAQNMTTAEMNAIDALPQKQQFRAIAHTLGLESYAGGQGGEADRCLTDPAAIAKLVAIHDQADRDYAIKATPLFLLNGEVIRAADWKTLRARIDAIAGS